MAHVIVKHTVEDFGKWKPIFDEDQSRRSRAGSKGAHVYRDAENPNALTIVMSFDSHDQAHAFANDPVLAETMGKAGVIGRPEVSFLDLIDTQSA